MAFSFPRLLDRWQNRILSFAGDVELKDHLNRSGMSYADFTLTSTQMDTIAASPVTLVAAPGSGLINQVIGIAVYVDAGSTQFTSTAMEFRYTNASGVKVTADCPAAQINSATDTYYFALGASGVPVVNAAIVATTAADVTAGNGTVYGRVYYMTWNPTEFA